jgi:NAD(P)-dependent dehydrogenase (short-subunit alcohol dehydrogenase family)
MITRAYSICFSCASCTLWGAALLVLAVAISVWLNDLADRSQYYPTHESGAVLVTGTHSGLGLAITRALAAKGYDVFATVRHASQLAMWEDTPRVHPLLMEDVGDPASVEQAFEALRTWLSESPGGSSSDRIKRASSNDCLQRCLIGVVNNAGIAMAAGLGDRRYTPAFLQKAFATNVFGVVYVTRSALPLLPAGGRVVNVGSVIRSAVLPGSDPYSATKHALWGLTASWRRELLDAQISVSYVEPGYFESNMGGKVGRDAGPPDETVAAILDAITSPNPRTNYITESVGDDPSWAVAFWFRMMPTRWMDQVMLSSL